MVVPTYALILALAAAPKLASPEWTVTEVKRELVSFYADSLAQALRAQGLQVVTAQDMATLLGMERQRQLLACDEGSRCIAELANALGCEATLTGNLVRFSDGGFRGLFKVIGSTDGQVLSSVTVEAANERKLLAELEGAAHALAAPLLSTTPKPAEASSSGSRRWWPLPAALTVASAAAAGILFGLASADAHRLSTENLDYPTALSLSTDGQRLQSFGWVAAGVAAAALLATVGVLAFGTSSDGPSLHASVGLTGVVLTGAF